MRMLATASNWPPSHLDEIADLLIKVPYPDFRPTQQRDSEYGLVIALAELGESLGLEPGDRKGGGTGDRSLPTQPGRWSSSGR
jgi:hypothetical protein